MPVRFFFAGTLTTLTFSSPGNVNEPKPFLCTEARMVASSDAMTARTALTSTAANSARWATRLLRLKAVLIGFTTAGLDGVAALTAFFAAAAFFAGAWVIDLFAVAMGSR